MNKLEKEIYVDATWTLYFAQCLKALINSGTLCGKATLKNTYRKKLLISRFCRSDVQANNSKKRPDFIERVQSNIVWTAQLL
jgi:hypothetical protein